MPLPEPPYFVVIFRSSKTEQLDGYGAMATRMLELASQQPGYLDVASYTDEQGNTVTLSYWQTERAIENWKNEAEHQQARKQGKQQWYQQFRLEVAQVQRAYEWQKND